MIYESNLNSVILTLETKLKNLENSDKLLGEISSSLFASNLKRIHQEGKSVDGSLIGSGRYGVNPMYINPSRSPKKFIAQGKNGENVFKNKKNHRTRYFGLGYFDFRSEIGRDVSKVNLQLFGKLQKDWAIEKSQKEYQIGFRSLYGSTIRYSMEEKYKQKIWGITKQDDEKIEEIKNRYIQNELKK